MAVETGAQIVADTVTRGVAAGASSTTREAASAVSREKIMNVAEQLMATHGYAATSIAAVCRDSGLPVGSVYHHFGSKVGLLRAITQRGSRRFFAELPRPSGPDGTPQERIVRHYRAAAQTILDNLSFFRIVAAMLLQPNADDEVQAVMAEVREGAMSQVGAILESIAAATGVPNSEEVGRRLADMTIVFTSGAVVEKSQDRDAFVAAFDGLRELVWNTLVRQVPSRTRPGSYRAVG